MTRLVQWIEVPDGSGGSGEAPEAPPYEGPPDPFWGRNPPWTVPSVPEHIFWGGRPRPPTDGRFMGRWAATRLRFAAILFGIGFFSVFLVQMDPQFQIVMGAPVFEEFLKFGLALLLVAWLPGPHGRGGLWAVVLPLRIIVALGVGGAFGAFEHWFSYPDEPRHVEVGRILFHGLSACLSMVTFTILEPLREVRARWFSTAAPTFLHYVNNAGAVVVGLTGAAFDLPEDVMFAIPVLVLAGLAACLLGIGTLGRQVRAWAMREVRERIEGTGSVFGGAPTAPPASGTPARSR